MKTSVNLPENLISEIRNWNKEHPEKQIAISGTSRKALETALKEARA